MSEVVFTPARYVCKGHLYSRDDAKLSVVLCPIASDGSIGADKWFTLNKTTRWLRPGAVYEIPSSENSIQARLAKFEAMWDDAELIAAWQVGSMAADAENEQERAHKRDADGRKELLKLLLPLRRAYGSRVATSSRLAIEMAVLYALRSPVKPGEGGGR